MFHRSARIIPLIRSCRRVPISAQSRNVWDARPLDILNVFRNLERQMENYERAFFGHPLRIITPRFLPIEGNEANKDSTYRVNLDVQGFKPEDIKVALKDGILRIEGHMERTGEDGSKFQQSIVREFTLPSNVEKSSVKSLLHEDGILSIEAQVNPEATTKPKEIPVLEEGAKSDKPKK